MDYGILSTPDSELASTMAAGGLAEPAGFGGSRGGVTVAARGDDVDLGDGESRVHRRGT